MTVAELIEELKKHPQDLEVGVWDPEFDCMRDLGAGSCFWICGRWDTLLSVDTKAHERYKNKRKVVLLDW